MYIAFSLLVLATALRLHRCNAAPSPLRTLLSWSHEHTFTPETESSEGAICFYDKVKIHSGECSLAQSDPFPGFPDPQLCEQASDAVCHALSHLSPGDASIHFSHVGNGTLQGNNTDCYAIGSNSEDFDAPMGLIAQTGSHLDPALRFEYCKQRFRDIQDCSQPVLNAGYNHQCVGGTIDEDAYVEPVNVYTDLRKDVPTSINSTVNSTNPYLASDPNMSSCRKARFGMGSPFAFGITEPDFSTMTQQRLKVDLLSRSTQGAFVTRSWNQKVSEESSSANEARTLKNSMPRRGSRTNDYTQLYERWKQVSAEAEARGTLSKRKDED